MALAIMSCADFPEIAYEERIDEEIIEVISGEDFTDSRDYKTYKTIIIGSQTWMSKNLEFTPATHSCYNGLATNCTKYGPLYDWDIAIHVCPDGWRLPSDDDWEILARNSGGVPRAGHRLKSKSGWAQDGNGIDSYGFNALPGGFVNENDMYRNEGFMAAWWSSTKVQKKEGSVILGRGITYEAPDIWQLELSGSLEMLSVRCIKED